MSPYEILSAEAYKNPLGELSRLFTEVMDLPGWRVELRTLENGLYRTKQTYMGKNPKDHKRILRELERMLAAGMELSKEHFDFYKIEKVKIKNILPPSVEEGAKYNYSALPVFLKPKALVNPVLELYDIFVERPFEQWLDIIRRWSFISESEETIENRGSTAFIPELYGEMEFTTLFQLVECCHLLFVRHLEYSTESLNKWLGKKWDEIWNRSLNHIKWLFYYYDIQFWRELLETVRSGYFDPQPVWYGRNPSDFIRYIEYLKEIVTHAEVLSNYHTDTQAEAFSFAGIEDVIYKGSLKNREPYHADFPKQFPLYLDADQIVSPLYFLYSFFKKNTKKDWHLFLDKCLLECMDHFGSLESHFSTKTQNEVNELIKMMEACNLILIKLIQKKEENESSQSKQ
ncbi:hypothetical protein [Algoriphagus sp.]|uniref:hypothetical protein n=1 Tax=Algoriphagus sp. TaxID=1872435 RepID=UPI002725FC0B|nr:hypothetical protein [Algoriphagus sp.]MDO8965053.1 hypothetical protein [Algoriphagus sp.]MDP3201862.1 hypothetical protein [Algoriphagus sp.]